MFNVTISENFIKARYIMAYSVTMRSYIVLKTDIALKLFRYVGEHDNLIC